MPMPNKKYIALAGFVAIINESRGVCPRKSCRFSLLFFNLVKTNKFSLLSFIEIQT